MQSGISTFLINPFFLINQQLSWYHWGTIQLSPTYSEGRFLVLLGRWECNCNRYIFHFRRSELHFFQVLHRILIGTFKILNDSLVVVVCTLIPTLKEAEAGRSLWVQVQHGLYRVSSKAVKATQRNPILKHHPLQKKTQHLMTFSTKIMANYIVITIVLHLFFVLVSRKIDHPLPFQTLYVVWKIKIPMIFISNKVY